MQARNVTEIKLIEVTSLGMARDGFSDEDKTLIVIYPVLITYMPGVSYHRQFRSFVCVPFWTCEASQVPWTSFVDSEHSWPCSVSDNCKQLRIW